MIPHVLVTEQSERKPQTQQRHTDPRREGERERESAEGVRTARNETNQVLGPKGAQNGRKLDG